MIDSKLGESVISDYSDHLLQSTFEVGMKGVDAANASKVQDLIIQTLSNLSVTGFEESDIRSSMNSIEFQLREFNTGGYPKGLSLMLGSLSRWIYDQNPVDALRYERPLADLKASIVANEPVFQQLIKDYLLENTHLVTVHMSPDAEYEAKRLAEEEKKLSEIKSSMTPEMLQSVVNSTVELLNAQAAEDSPEAKATLPRLTLEDIDKNQTEIPIQVSDFVNKEGESIARGQKSKLLTHLLPTNGILYANIAVDIASKCLIEYF